MATLLGLSRPLVSAGPRPCIRVRKSYIYCRLLITCEEPVHMSRKYASGQVGREGNCDGPSQGYISICILGTADRSNHHLT